MGNEGELGQKKCSDENILDKVTFITESVKLDDDDDDVEAEAALTKAETIVEIEVKNVEDSLYDIHNHSV